MIKFKYFMIESKASAPGIQHLEHPADRTFDGQKAAEHALSTIKGVASGKTPITRKIDDKMSYQAIRTPEGKVGVKYKGPGAAYNFSAADVQKQHGHKPYLAEPLKLLHKHLDKVLPKRPGEYQGGYMSGRNERTNDNKSLSHKPNTITYSTPAGSQEGKKLGRSHVSTVIHSELKGERRAAHPITDTSEFGSHPDVHLIPHIVSSQERVLPAHNKKTIDGHLKAASNLMKGHTYDHLTGHEIPLRTYVNSTVRAGTTPNVAGYAAHLGAAHDKKIAGVKLEKTKEAKRNEKNDAMAHINKHKEAFKKTFDIHHHLQGATNELASALDSHGAGGFNTTIDGNKSEGEGYVGGGLKVVNRKGFSAANLAKSDSFKKPIKEATDTNADVHHDITFARMNPITTGHEAVVKQVVDNARKNKGDHTIILSGSHDRKKNPLTPEQKLKHAKGAFPNTTIKLADKANPTLLHHASDLHSRGVTHITVHVGSDRVKEMHDLLHNYNGRTGTHGSYNFKKITVMPVGAERKEGGDGVAAASGTAMRRHAMDNDRVAFHKMAPSKMSSAHKDAMMKDVRHNMGLNEGSLKRFGTWLVENLT